MNKPQLENIQKHFNDYARSFFCDDDYINSNLQMKLCHSYRVQREAKHIADSLGLGRNDKNLAIAIGIVHDIGRFPQFVKYKTYCDPRSTNHCRLGVEAMKEIAILKELPDEEQQIIFAAVEYHGIKEIPSHIEGNTLLHSRIIRDADKIDIFEVVIDGYKVYRDNPDDFVLELEYSDSQDYTQEVFDAVMANQRVDYNKAKTMNDNWLLQIAWVYDINFAVAFEKIVQRKYIQQLFEFLPKTTEMQTLYDHIFSYINSRTAAIQNS